MRKHFLIALTFAAISLAAVFLASFVWLTEFLYHDSIGGYVPAGITGMSHLFLAWLVLQFPLIIVGLRRRRTSHYLAGGCLGVPVAILLAAIYCNILYILLGHSFQKRVDIAAAGVIVFLVASIVFYDFFMRKKADDNSQS